MASVDAAECTGSGVLLVDTRSSSLLLVYDYTLNYNCFGGRIKYDLDDRERREKTAKDELYEETRTLLSCDLSQLVQCPFVDVNFRDSLFRCYIVKTRCPADICQQFESYPLEQLPDEDEFRETTRLAFFPLKQFQTRKSWSKIVKKSIAQDKYRIDGPLNRRVINVIEAAMQQNLLWTQISPRDWIPWPVFF